MTGTDCSGKIRVIGRLAFGVNAFVMFGVLLFDYQCSTTNRADTERWEVSTALV